jgi:hypothetical protein
VYCTMDTGIPKLTGIDTTHDTGTVLYSRGTAMSVVGHQTNKRQGVKRAKRSPRAPLTLFDTPLVGVHR